jgi:hypothetical protein
MKAVAAITDTNLAVSGRVSVTVKGLMRVIVSSFMDVAAIVAPVGCAVNADDTGELLNSTALL